MLEVFLSVLFRFTAIPLPRCLVSSPPLPLTFNFRFYCVGRRVRLLSLSHTPKTKKILCSAPKIRAEVATKNNPKRQLQHAETHHHQSNGPKRRNASNIDNATSTPTTHIDIGKPGS